MIARLKRTSELTVSASQGPNIDDPEMKGIIPRITEQVFASIMTSPANLEYLVKVSYMEIYMERIRDLLSRKLASSASHVRRERN